MKRIKKICLLIGILVLGNVFYMLKIQMEYQEGRQIYEEYRNEQYRKEISIEEIQGKNVSPIEFSRLERVNQEVVAWIWYEEANINYPIVQGKDNEYYLTRTFNHKENACGTIMLNCDNSSKFSDGNTILYGHNMKDGSMFGGIEKLKNKDSISTQLWIYTPEQVLKYVVFSIAEVNVNHEIYQLSYTETEFEECIKQLQNESFFWDLQKEIEEIKERELLTLSTCLQNKRIVLVAYLEEV